MRQQINCFLRAPLIDQKLAELFERRPIIGFMRENLAQHLLRFRVLVLEAIETREPQQGKSVVRLGFQDRLKLINGFRQIFLLHFARAHVAKRADVDAGQQPVRVHIVRINLQRFLRLDHCVANMLRLRVDLGEPLQNHSRVRLDRQRFLVRLDGLRRHVGVGGHLVLLLLKMAHREVVIRVGVGGIGRRLGRRGSLSGSLRQRRLRTQKDGENGRAKDYFHV